jgi:hypothetical protein
MAHELLAYLSDEFDETDVTAMRDLAVDLRDAHSWRFEAPYFVDEAAVGLVLPLSLNGEDQDVPVADLNVLVKGLARLSFSRHLEIELRLDDDSVGWIVDGDPDDAIREGLLASWGRGRDGGRVPGAAVQYQLVLQWPASSVDDYDDMVALEEFLIENLAHGEVDGHDGGQGEVNIFILTDDPEATFASVKALLDKRRAWLDIRIAYRETTRDHYHVLWPDNLVKFEVA